MRNSEFMAGVQRLNALQFGDPKRDRTPTLREHNQKNFIQK